MSNRLDVYPSRYHILLVVIKSEKNNKVHAPKRAYVILSKIWSLFSLVKEKVYYIVTLIITKYILYIAVQMQ